MKKATEFSINLPDIPGALNDVCVALSKYDVNIQSIAGVATKDCTLAMITDDDFGTRKAFDELGAEYFENETLTISCNKTEINTNFLLAFSVLQIFSAFRYTLIICSKSWAGSFFEYIFLTYFFRYIISFKISTA